MTPEIIDQLLREAESLQKKMDAINNMLEAYGYNAPTASKFIQGAVKLKNKSVVSDKTSRVLDRCVPLVASYNGQPVKTRDILEILESENFEIGGKKKVATLSAMLSNSKKFESIGRSGWVLKINDDLSKEEGSSEQTQEPSFNYMGVQGMSDGASYPSAVGSNPTTSTINQTTNQEGGVYGTYNPFD